MSNELSEFPGYARKPESSEVLLCLSVLNYLKNKFGFTYASYIDENQGPITPKTISNAETTKSLNSSSYKALTRKMFERLTRTHSDGSHPILDELDPYICPLVEQLFPMLKELLEHRAHSTEARNARRESIFLRYAVKDSSTLALLSEKFSNGGFIYRYARNLDEGQARNPRIAKGKLAISGSASSQYLRFSVLYRVDSQSDLNDPYDSLIEGRVMQMKSFFVFVGVENEKHNPFFMVMKAELAGSRFKGIILRKHPDKSYFASRVMISRNTGKQSEKTGKFYPSDLPEIDGRQLGLIENRVPNEGRSILMLES